MSSFDLKKPCLSDYGLSKESYRQRDLLEKEQNEQNKIFFHFVAGFSILVCSIWYVANVEKFNIWEFAVLLLFPAPMTFIILMCLWCTITGVLKINVPPLGENEEIQRLNKSIKEYEQAVKEYEYQQNLKKRQFWLNMSPREFEIAVAQYFKNQGYDIGLTQYSNDGGVDVVAIKNNEKVYIQCKHYSNKVGVAPARELYGVMCSDEIKYGCLVSLYGFTSGVYDFVIGKNIKLLDVNQMTK